MLKPPFPEVESEVTAAELGLSTFALSCGCSTDLAGALAWGIPFLSISERNAVKKSVFVKEMSKMKTHFYMSCEKFLCTNTGKLQKGKKILLNHSMRQNPLKELF